ncbi:response regulator [Steroidobacter sp. S1-65]|uniref:histidine kinase n=1 Tax=Steroidobacter gossypii TaxID=2805490 RepID=A0ABS1X4M0_9GAMM|nr:response regulator [Steroidobacter gossypii]MBM0108165.1 response regulator [Steroidobacter gossypii]
MHASSLGQTGLSDPAPNAALLGSEHFKTPVGAQSQSAHSAADRRSWLPVWVRIGAGFGVALVLLAVLGMGVNSRLTASQLERRWMQQSQEVLRKNEHALRLMRQAESAARGFRLSEASMFRHQFDSAVIETERTLEELRTLTEDNSTQQQLVGTLIPVVRQRFDSMRRLFDPRRTDTEALVLEGAALMERVEQLAASIDREDRRLLEERRARARAAEALARQVSTYGSLTVVLLIALVGWFVSRSILRPVAAMAAGASRIGRGDYQQPIPVHRRDELGRLAMAFNDMAAQIAARERALAEQDWLNSSLARLSRLMEGARDPKKLGTKLLGELAVLLGARQSLIYAPAGEEGIVLELQASYASDNPPQRLIRGQGLIGQCYRDCTGVVLDKVPEDYLRISSALGRAPAAQVVVMPAAFEGRVKAVIELATLSSFSAAQLTLLQRFCESYGTVLHALEAAKKTEELLAEATSLSEKLREQQIELQQANAEMEQVNEELQQSNVEMEERATVLQEQREALEHANKEVEVARAALEEKVQQLALSSKYQSEFLANMSHELRTPLNSLLILSKILAENNEGTLTPKQVERANTIHGAGHDLLELINDILDLAKIESGTVTAEIMQVRVRDITQQMRQAFDHVAENAHLRFTVDVADDVPEMVITDGRRLQQILRNLLSNAFKFTSKGGVTLKVERAASGWGDHVPTLAAADEVVAFHVIDTGIGVAQDRQELVFEAFRQADAGTSRRYGGTGLGLSISRELSRLLQGALTIDSTPGVGSTFSLYLPRAMSADAPVREAPETAAVSRPTLRLVEQLPVTPESPRLEETEAASEDDRLHLLPGERILLVIEDDRSFAAVLADFAREKGFKVIIERSAQEAIRATRRYKPSAITLDLLLRDSNGWAVLDRLKHDPELRHVPVHVISVEDQRERALMQGALTFLHKPVTREMLDEVLGDTLELLDNPTRRLLIVEDDQRQRGAVVDLFSATDVEIVARGTAAEALQALGEGRFHCMITDLVLPDMSGADLIATMQRRWGRNSPPVVIYTGKPLSRAEETELRAVSEAIIVKDASSLERLLDETALLLHYPAARLPESRRQLLERARKEDPTLRGRSVLVVDDDVRNIFAITAGLESHHMRVRYAESGAAAIEILQSPEQFDVVLMDVMMPEMDGFEAIRRIRRIERHAQLPIIVLTAKAMARAREECLQSGASDYLAKPVDLDQLRSMLRVWLYRER